MNHKTENYHDQEIEFTYEGHEFTWQGDYSIEQTFEDESEYAPSLSEMEVKIDYTTSLSYYDEDLEQNVEVVPTPSILMALELQIERNY